MSNQKTPVSRLEEHLAATMQQAPTYEFTPSTCRKFVCTLQLNGISVAEEGFSKQQAKHNAARKALDNILQDDDPLDQIIESIEKIKLLPEDELIEFNSVGSLQSYCKVNSIEPPRYEFSCKVSGYVKEYTYICTTFFYSATGTGLTKKIAKMRSARSVLEMYASADSMELAELIKYEMIKDRKILKENVKTKKSARGK